MNSEHLRAAFQRTMRVSKWGLYGVIVFLWWFGCAPPITIQPCSSETSCASGSSCQQGYCAPINGENKPLPPEDPEKAVGAIPNACTIEKPCAEGYFCRGTTCIPTAYRAELCQAAQETVVTEDGICRLKLRCLYDDNRQCSPEEIKRREDLLACFRQGSVCKDPTGKYLIDCGKKFPTPTATRNSGCYFRLEITDVTVQIRTVGGTVACDKQHASGSSGERPLRVILGAKDGQLVDLSALAKPPFSLSRQDFHIVRTEVFDPVTGDMFRGATVEATLTTQFQIRANPQMAQIARKQSFDPYPRASQLLIDTSIEAARLDHYTIRGRAIAAWLLESYPNNENSVISAFLFRGYSLAPEDRLFQTDPDQQLGLDGKKLGFLPFNRNNQETLSSFFTKLDNSTADSYAPVFDAIAEGVINLRGLQTPEQRKYLPQVIALSLTQDASVSAPTDPRLKTRLNAKLQEQVKGTGKLDFVPVMSVLSHSKDGSTSREKLEELARWDARYQAHCSIAQAATDGSGAYWGQVFAPRASHGELLIDSWVSNLKLASLAATGYIEMGVQYKLSGVPTGQRVAIAVTLGINYHGKESRDNIPILFHATP